MGAPTGVPLPSSGFNGTPYQGADAYADLVRRVEALERNRSLASSSITDDAGITRVKTGRFSHPGDGSDDFGLEVAGPAGLLLFLADQYGLSKPGVQGSVRDPNANMVVTAGAFTQTWAIVFPAMATDGIYLELPVVCDAGTTAEAYLSWGGGAPSPNDSGVITCPAGVSTECTWRWAPTWLVPGSGDGFQLVAMVRRTGGAGNVTVYQPPRSSNLGAKLINATPTGV